MNKLLLSYNFICNLFTALLISFKPIIEQKNTCVERTSQTWQCMREKLLNQKTFLWSILLNAVLQTSLRSAIINNKPLLLSKKFKSAGNDKIVTEASAVCVVAVAGRGQRELLGSKGRDSLHLRFTVARSWNWCSRNKYSPFQRFWKIHVDQLEIEKRKIWVKLSNFIKLKKRDKSNYRVQVQLRNKIIQLLEFSQIRQIRVNSGWIRCCELLWNLIIHWIK